MAVSVHYWLLFFQAPKKYSVFNDIFRYQDEMFEEAENDDTYEENTGERWW